MDFVKKRCYPLDTILHEESNVNKKRFLPIKKQNYLDLDFKFDLNLQDFKKDKSENANGEIEIGCEEEETITKHLIKTMENLHSTEVLDDSFCIDFIEQKWSDQKVNKGFCENSSTSVNNQNNFVLFENNFQNNDEKETNLENEKKKLKIDQYDPMNESGYCFINEFEKEGKSDKVDLFEEDSLECLLISSLLPNQASKNQGKITLILDLDQTLVYSNTKKPDHYDFKCIFKDEALGFDQIIQNEEATEQIIYVQKRPYLDHFLEECAKLFEVVIFTAGIKEYADQVLDHIDPDNSRISHRLYRDSCKKFEGSFFVKDLSLLGRKLAKCIIVDDQPYSYRLQPENAIPIQEFLGSVIQTENLQSQDLMLNNELNRILKILQQFENCDNVFPILEKIKKY
ncbi:nuclear lim interactor-interacting factor-related [Anaeramoeba flamelloides]|uniref:Nuclear lim interactor-interacting factor-related n=1 Tax=Anaeramoeba flamelloides TaxID=1746091 RepID=A0ABQ8ZET0_9EUKA|nr:nuclear lim interactor-interacting factor-related [Anaeramoeba flamelloides]